MFVGDVVSIGGCGRERAVRFEVTEAFKGVEVGDTVTLTTAADGAGCGVDFAAADAWLVVSQDGESANLCSGTAPSADAGTLLEEIRALP